MTARLTRRTTLAGAAVAGVPLLAGCGSDGNQPTTSASEPTPTPPSPTRSARTRPPTPEATDEQPPAEVFAETGEIPVGGGRVFSDERVVVTQPEEGEFRGFSAVCTHRGCLVATVARGTIGCRCHGSSFSIEDGSVVTGPAATRLPAVALEVGAGQIGLA